MLALWRLFFEMTDEDYKPWADKWTLFICDLSPPNEA